MIETQEILKLGIGTKEKSTLKPARCKIVNISMKTKTNDGTEMKTPLVEINVKHPDKEDLLTMTKIKLERNDKLDVVSTWLVIEEEEGIKKLSKSSGIAHLMRYLGSNSLSDLYNKEVDLIEQSKEDSYLCIKSY